MKKNGSPTKITIQESNNKNTKQIMKNKVQVKWRYAVVEYQTWRLR